MDNEDAVFAMGDSHVERFGAQTLAERRAAKRAEERELRERAKQVTRFIGKIAGGLGKACGMW